MKKPDTAATKKLAYIVNSGGMMRDAGVEDIAWAAARSAGERLGCVIQTVYAFGRDDDPFAIIQSADAVLADVSRRNPDVLNAVGFADGLSKPIIVLAADPSEVPRRHRNKQVFIWTGSTTSLPPASVMAQIADALVSVLQDTRDAVEAAPRRTKLFISYAHVDGAYLRRLFVHLRPLEAAGLVELWSDRKIRPGDRWKDEIRAALSTARVALLLISADFLASDFIRKDELPPLLLSAENNGTRIVSIILKPCRFKREPQLSKFQAANDPNKPVIKMSEAEREELYDHVVEEIELELPTFSKDSQQ